MKTRLFCTALALAAALTLAACANSPADDGAAQAVPQEGTAASPNEDAPGTDREENADGRITYPEEEMPTNTPEDEAYLQQYVYPYAVTGIFSDNFGPGDMAGLYGEHPGHLLSIFNAFALARPDNELSLTDEDTTLDQDIVEGVLRSHLDLTAEEIRAACADYYDAEDGTYTYNYGLGGGPFLYVVTNSSLDNDVLTLEYDAFGGDYDSDSETFGYVMNRQGVLVIEIDGDNFKFISNTVQNAPGMD